MESIACSITARYWLRVDKVRKGFTTEAVCALAKVAFELMGIERLDLRCDTASAGVARKVGFVLEGTLRHRKSRPDEAFADDLAFSMIASDDAASLASTTRLRAFDVMEAPLA